MRRQKQELLLRCLTTEEVIEEGNYLEHEFEVQATPTFPRKEFRRSVHEGQCKDQPIYPIFYFVN
jgi:hypothetical protein